MKPPFNFYSFKETVNMFMLERAVRIFKENEIRNLLQISPGQWTANITGMRDYSIKVNIKNEEIVSCSCNCPYDLDPVCKHIGSVLIAIEELHPEQVTYDFEKRHSRIVENILKRLDYNKIWWDTIIENRTTPELSKLIEKAKLLCENQDYQKAITIYCVIIQQIFSIFQRNGQSSYTLNNLINEIIHHIIKIKDFLLPEMKERLFYFCKREYGKLEGLEYFHFPESFLDLFRSMVFNPQLEEDFFSFIDSKKELDEEKFQMSDHYRHLLKTQLSYLEETGREEEALNIRENQKDDYSFLNELIAFEIERKNYEKAKKLALDDVKGKRLDKDFKSRWDYYLLRIAKETNNFDEMRLYSERSYFQHRNISDYRDLKSTYTDDSEWKQKVEAIIQKSGFRKKFKYYSIIRNLVEIFIEENYWDRLIELFNEVPDQLWILGNFYDPIPHEQIAKVIALYNGVITSQLLKYQQYKYYEITLLLEKLSRIPGGNLSAARIIHDFQILHPEETNLIMKFKSAISGDSI